MASIAVSYQESEHSDKVLNKSVNSVVKSNELLTLATNGPDGVHISAAYFAYDKDFNLFFLSAPTTTHAQNIKTHSQVAAMVVDSHQSWEVSKHGIQLTGHAELASGAQLIQAPKFYFTRFPGLKRMVRHPITTALQSLKTRFYVMRVDKVKITDEPVFGEELQTSATVKR